MDHQQTTPLPQPTAPATPDPEPGATGDLQALMLAGHAVLEGCQAVGAEMLAFWQSRLKDGLATGTRLVECTSVESAVDIQLDYAKAALQAYLDESVRLSELAMRMVTGGLMPRSGAGSARRATPLAA